MVNYVLFMSLGMLLAAADNEKIVNVDNIKMCREIANNLNEMKQRGVISGLEMDVIVHDDNVTVSGRIDSVKEARAVLDAVCDVANVGGIRLNLGIGRQPATLRRHSFLSPELWNQPLKWNDDSWRLDFERD